MVFETFESENYRIEFDYDEHAESPREWGNTCIMLLEHGRYDLGDENIYAGLNYEDGWAGMLRDIEIDYPDHHIFEMSLYIHSGMALNIGGPTCPWDSGRVGFGLVPFSAAKDEDEALEILQREVDVYNAYLSGDVFGYSLFSKDGDVLDSCSGFYDTYDLKQVLDDMDSEIVKELEPLF